MEETKVNFLLIVTVCKSEGDFELISALNIFELVKN